MHIHLHLLRLLSKEPLLNKQRIHHLPWQQLAVQLELRAVLLPAMPRLQQSLLDNRAAPVCVLRAHALAHLWGLRIKPMMFQSHLLIIRQAKSIMGTWIPMSAVDFSHHERLSNRFRQGLDRLAELLTQFFTFDFFAGTTDRR